MPTIKEKKRRVTGSLENETVERTFFIAPDTGEEATVYQYAVDLMYRILGGSSPIGPQMVRKSPFFDPYLKGCYASEVEINGEGYFKTGETPSLEKMLTGKSYYEGVEFVIRYKTMEAEQDQGGGSPTQDHDEEIELATEQWDFGAQNLTQTGKLLWAKSDNNGPLEPIENEEAKPVKTIPKVDYTLTRNYVVNLPRAAISGLLGKVNGSVFGKAPKKGIDRSYPIETLRFDGATISRRITSKKVEYFKVAYKFAHNPIYERIFNLGDATPLAVKDATLSKGFVGWNRIWREAFGWWEHVYSPSGPTLDERKLYKYDSTYSQSIKGVAVSGFNLLFHPAAT